MFFKSDYGSPNFDTDLSAGINETDFGPKVLTPTPKEGTPLGVEPTPHSFAFIYWIIAIAVIIGIFIAIVNTLGGRRCSGGQGMIFGLTLFSKFKS